MEVKVLFFANLREQLKMSDCSVSIDEAMTVEQLWKKVTEDEPVPGNLLCAINMEYVSLQERVKAGDEVAFFPPVTGG